MKQLLCTLTLLASVLASTSAVGATMRCNDGIVSTGESTQGVLDKCGAPSSQVTDSPAIDENGFVRSEEHTSELQSREKLVCRLPLENTKCDAVNEPCA